MNVCITLKLVFPPVCKEFQSEVVARSFIQGKNFVFHTLCTGIPYVSDRYHTDIMRFSWSEKIGKLPMPSIRMENIKLSQVLFGRTYWHPSPPTSLTTATDALSSDLPLEIKEEVIVQYFQLNEDPSICSSICLINKSINHRVSPLFQRVKGPYAFADYYKATSVMKAIEMNLSREKIKDIMAALNAEDVHPDLKYVRSNALWHCAMYPIKTCTIIFGWFLTSNSNKPSFIHHVEKVMCTPMVIKRLLSDELINDAHKISLTVDDEVSCWISLLWVLLIFVAINNIISILWFRMMKRPCKWHALPCQPLNQRGLSVWKRSVSNSYTISLTWVSFLSFPMSSIL